MISLPFCCTRTAGRSVHDVVEVVVVLVFVLVTMGPDALLEELVVVESVGDVGNFEYLLIDDLHHGAEPIFNAGFKLSLAAFVQGN